MYIYNKTPITRKYNKALERARKFGGRKFNNKTYGGGIVFQCYNLHELAQDIKNAVK